MLKATAAAPGLMEKVHHVLTHGELLVEAERDLAVRPIEGDGIELVLSAKAPELALQEEGVLLAGLHGGKALLFAIELLEQFAKARGLGHKGLGGILPCLFRKAAIDEGLAGFGKGGQGAFEDGLAPFAAHSFELGRGQGPRRDLTAVRAVGAGALVKENVTAAELKVGKQGAGVHGVEMGDGAAQGRGEHAPFAPAFGGQGAEVGRPCGIVVEFGFTEAEDRAFAQVEAEPGLGLTGEAEPELAFGPAADGTGDALVGKVLAQAHHEGGRLGVHRDAVVRHEEQWGFAVGPQDEEALTLAAVAAVERKNINIRARSMDLFHAGPNKMWNEFVAEAAEEMSVHSELREGGLAAPDFFAFFLTGFAGNAERGDRAGLEAGEADVFAAFFADAVFAVFHALEGFLDLGDELAFTVADAEGEGTVRLGGGAVGRIGVGSLAVRHFFQRGIAVALGFDEHLVEQVTEVFEVLRGQRFFLLQG